MQALSKLILVPGPGDPGDVGVLPQRPLVSAVAAPLLESGADVLLATNPCRVQFYTRELVVLAGERTRRFQQGRLLQQRGARPLPCFLKPQVLVCTW